MKIPGSKLIKIHLFHKTAPTVSRDALAIVSPDFIEDVDGEIIDFPSQSVNGDDLFFQFLTSETINGDHGDFVVTDHHVIDASPVHEPMNFVLHHVDAESIQLVDTVSQTEFAVIQKFGGEPFSHERRAKIICAVMRGDPPPTGINLKASHDDSALRIAMYERALREIVKLSGLTPELMSDRVSTELFSDIGTIHQIASGALNTEIKEENIALFNETQNVEASLQLQIKKMKI